MAGGAGVPAELFRDTRYVVLNKPAGLPVHAGPRGAPSVEDVFPLLSRRRNGPWLAHRLDTDTAGCLVIALTKTALIAAQAAFAGGRAAKTYWAITQGVPTLAHGTLTAALRKQTGEDGWRMVIDPAGAPAISDWRCLAARDGLALLEMRPRTGRTHQVRVHCAALGCPILGDPLYGAAGDGAPQMQLLARAIALPLLPPLAATAPVPPHMAAYMARFADQNARAIP